MKEKLENIGSQMEKNTACKLETHESVQHNSGLCRPNSDRRRKKSLLFFSVLFLFGLILSFQFGEYWDEASEACILKRNAVEYTARLFPKGSKIRTISEGQLGISQSIERDHGTAIMYPIAPVLATEEIPELNVLDSRSISCIWHTYIYLVSFTAVIALYYIGKRIFKNELEAYFPPLLFFFSPRIFAEMHYNNKDVLLLVLAIDALALVISAVDSWKCSRHFSLKKIILLSFVGGLAMNTKIVGIAIVGLLGMLLIGLMICEKVPTKKIIFISAGTLSLACAFYYMLTPAMWGGVDRIVDFHQYALNNANAFSRWDKNILFEGALYKHSNNPLPWYYLLKILLLTTPVAISVFFCVGLIFAIIDVSREKTAYFKKPENLTVIFSALEFIIPMLYASVTKTHVYNGWRHFYFTYLGYIIVSAYGIVRVRSSINKTVLKKSFTGLIGLCVFMMIAGICINHPLECCYYNPLVSHAHERYEMDYWNVGAKNVIKSLLDDCEETDIPISVSASDSASMAGIKNAVANLKCGDKIALIGEADGAEYIIENTTYGKTMERSKFDEDKYEISKCFYSYGNLVYTIYKLK